MAAPSAGAIAGTARVGRTAVTKHEFAGERWNAGLWGALIVLCSVPEFVRMILPIKLLIGVSFAVCFPSLNIQAMQD